MTESSVDSADRSFAFLLLSSPLARKSRKGARRHGRPLVKDVQR